ncbi:hypothetical protein ACS0PU_011479 [Formica fusca]
MVQVKAVHATICTFRPISESQRLSRSPCVLRSSSSNRNQARDALPQVRCICTAMRFRTPLLPNINVLNAISLEFFQIMNSRTKFQYSIINYIYDIIILKYY